MAAVPRPRARTPRLGEESSAQRTRMRMVIVTLSAEPRAADEGADGERIAQRTAAQAAFGVGVEHKAGQLSAVEIGSRTVIHAVRRPSMTVVREQDGPRHRALQRSLRALLLGDVPGVPGGRSPEHRLDARPPDGTPGAESLATVGR